jgi:N-acetylglutamate synthase-like GNAT family acetyltransferase
MSESFVIREATAQDLEAIGALLRHAGLDPAGVLTSGSRYWVAEEAGALLGVVGLEYGPQAVLLRSAAVRGDMRGRGIGARLFGHAYAMAAADQITAVYCFSTDAGDYWTRHGFREVPVPELCAALPDAFQVHHYHELGWLPTEVAWRKDLTIGEL